MLLWSGMLFTMFPCFIVHCYLSLVMVTSGIVSCAFLFVCPFYCFQLEHCLIVHCGYIFYLFWVWFSNCFRMSSTGSIFLCFSYWPWGHCSAVICVVVTWLLILVINHPVFVMHIVYDMLLWLWSPFPTIVPWVHGPPSSC